MVIMGRLRVAGFFDGWIGLVSGRRFSRSLVFSGRAVDDRELVCVWLIMDGGFVIMPELLELVGKGV